MAEEGPCISAVAARHSPVLESGNLFPRSSLEKSQILAVDNNNNTNNSLGNDLQLFTMDASGGEGSTANTPHHFGEEDEEEDEDGIHHNKLSEQRSESDSDLDSCDDFSIDGNNKNADKDNCAVGDEIKDNKDITVRTAGSAEQFNKSVLNGSTADGRTEKPVSRETHASGRSTLGSFYGEDDVGRVPPGNGLTSTSSRPSNDGRGLHQEIHREAGKVLNLTEEEMLLKMNDPEVVETSQVTDSLTSISLTNLSKLEHMDKSDPAVKRLLTRPRVTVQQVKSINIDADIKSMVNEFLRTNITNNFIIARVLRENYATFYQWLATHLQVERNAWASRLKQALFKMDHEHKDNIATQHLVVESGVRLRNLVQACSTAMFGLPGKDPARKCPVTGQLSHTNPEVRESSGKTSGTRLQQQRRGPAVSSCFSDADSAYQTRKNNFHQRLTALGRVNERTTSASSHLSQSSFNLVRVSTPGKGKVNYESDPGVYPSSRDFFQPMNKDAETTRRIVSMRAANNAVKRTRSFTTKRRNEPCMPDTDGSVTYKDNGFSEVVDLELDPDDDTDWKKVISDNLEVLTEICETLVNDRANCLQLVGVRPNHCASLVEAVSTYAQDRHSSGNSKRREIEKRVGVLEIENRTLVEEMTALQKTLGEKNNDALNLQKQLDRLESLVYENSKIKVNKCVGTDSPVTKTTAKPGVLKTSKSPFRRGKIDKSSLGKASISKSPYLNEKMTQSINGVHIMMLQNKKAGDDKKSKRTDQSIKDSPSEAQIESTAEENLNMPINGPRPPMREKSLIELSEEKLKTLKQRARKLEDSLHDAINSMEKLNKTVPHSDSSASTINAISASAAASLVNKSSRTNNHNTSNRDQPKFWSSAASFHFRSPQSVIADNSVASPALVTVKHSGRGVDIPKILLDTEKSSLLSGKSMHLSPHIMSERTPVPSSLRVSANTGLQRTKSASKVNVGESFHLDNGIHHSLENDNNINSELEEDLTEDEVNSLTQKDYSLCNSSIKKKRKIISRLKPAGKGVVSKCLRCQKLFNCVDNHKLACCYHTKDKERIEQYDQSGKLVNVLYAWKCCQQPQESEGCIYGQHV